MEKRIRKTIQIPHNSGLSNEDSTVHHQEDLMIRIRKFDQGALKSGLKRKYKIMAQSTFKFYRGTARLFYDDLKLFEKLPSSPICWLCGDMHVENFGSFRGDDKLVYFDINDFDEALLGPVAWDLLRAVTSIYVAFDSLGIAVRYADKAGRLFLKKYSAVLREGKALYINPHTATDMVRYFLKKTEKEKQSDLLDSMTQIRKGKTQFKEDGKEIVRVDKKEKEKLNQTFKTWMKSNAQPPNHFEMADACFRNSGDGSLGAKHYLLLIQKLRDKKKFRIIDMKEGTPAAASHYTHIPQPPWKSEADRVVRIQKRMQYSSPAQLSTTSYCGSTYIMKQMQPVGDHVDFAKIKDRFGDVCSVMKDMAVLTASAHLRSASREGSCSADDLIAFGNSNSWQERIIEFAKSYAHRTKNYFDEFVTEYKKRKSGILFS